MEKLDIIFEQVLKEADKEVSNSNVPFEDTPQAWFEIDTTGPESEDVICGNFVWHREKSNRNITDTGDGKGFSFYLARYVFEDPYVVEIENDPDFHSKPVIGNNSEESQSTSEVIYCTNCGAQIDADSKFCTNCGTKL